MLRNMFGFDHCIKGDATQATVVPAYDWVTTSGHSIVQQANVNGANSLPTLDGWLGYGLTPAWYNSASIATFFNINHLDATATKLYIGTRIRSYSSYVGTDIYIALATGQANLTALMTIGEIPALRTSGNASCYVEFEIDINNGTKTMYVDGVKFSGPTAITINATLKAALLAGNYQLMLRQVIWVGGVTAYWYRDTYVADNVAGADGVVGLLGPQQFIPTYLDQVTGTWTPDDGSTDLKATLNAALPATPQVKSPTDKSALSSSLAAAIPDGYGITAVQLVMSSKSLGDTPTTTKVEIKQGSGTITPPAILSPKAMTYGQRIGFFTKAPDGGAWNASKLDNTTIVLTPDQ